MNETGLINQGIDDIENAAHAEAADAQQDVTGAVHAEVADVEQDVTGEAEKVADVVKAARDHVAQGSYGLGSMLFKDVAGYIDRIEAAYHREIDKIKSEL